MWYGEQIAYDGYCQTNCFQFTPSRIKRVESENKVLSFFPELTIV